MSRPLITVKRLRTQARDRGAIELPADALVTPAAEDWLRASELPVHRTETVEQPTEAGPPVYVVGDARNSVLQTLLPILERQHDGVEFFPCHGHLAGCLEAVREMCAGLAQCSRRRGIALLEDGAIVNCVANKHAGVRAAIPSKPSALFGLMRRLGMNLLILEIGRFSLRQIQAMLGEFLSGKTSSDPIIESALARLPASIGPGEVRPCGGGR